MSMQVEIKKELKGFSLDAAFSSAGRLGVLGASGCGKSMTLKCIAGIVRPDSGRIVLNGRVLFDSAQNIDIKPQQRKVGYLFQNYALFPHMTVLENVACGMRLAKKEAHKDKRVGEMIDLLHLNGLEERFPLQLSGGQQQRVALARILAYQPEIILLDEPFSALDEYLREQLQLEMTEILRQWGDNIILVTHNRDEVYRLTDHLVVMEGGHIIGDGKTSDLFASPGRMEVAKLTGCKNISRARKYSDNTVEALDWGITLTTREEIPSDISAVGIRAHSFYPTCEGELNSFSVRFCDQITSPFENTVIFATPGGESIWWKYAAGLQQDELPRFLSVQPENVLLLK